MEEVVITRQERQEVLARCPWIARLKNSRPCDGLTWGKVPLKALYAWGPKRQNPPTGTDKYKCKKPARWRFTASKRYDAKSGTYCWSHLWQQMDHMGEYERFRRWWEKQPEREQWKARIEQEKNDG
jgi:hypothetical protein